MKKEKKKYPPLVRLLILSTVTIFFWIGFEVYRVLSVKPPPVVSQETLAPVNPSLDVPSLDELQKRLHLSESEISETIIIPQVEETPQPEAVSEQTDEEVPSVASESGEENI